MDHRPPDDQPRIQRGPCDPNGGVHAAFAALVALEQRERTGVGSLVEVAMFDAAIGIAAEPAIEWSAYGHLVERDGNRAVWAAPQGVYPTATTDRSLALSVTTDGEWQALAAAIGRSDLAADDRRATLEGRRCPPRYELTSPIVEHLATLGTADAIALLHAPLCRVAVVNDRARWAPTPPAFFMCHRLASAQTCGSPAWHL